MTPRRPIHTPCSFYCQGDQHAILCLTTPDITARDITDHATRSFTADGWQVLRVLPAREAHAPTWRTTDRGWDIPPTPAATACWLIVVAPLEVPKARAFPRDTAPQGETYAP